MSPYHSRRVLSPEELKELRRVNGMEIRDFQASVIDRKVPASTYHSVKEFPSEPPLRVRRSMGRSRSRSIG